MNLTRLAPRLNLFHSFLPKSNRQSTVKKTLAKPKLCEIFTNENKNTKKVKLFNLHNASESSEICIQNSHGAAHNVTAVNKEPRFISPYGDFRMEIINCRVRVSHQSKCVKVPLKSPLERVLTDFLFTTRHCLFHPPSSPTSPNLN